MKHEEITEAIKHERIRFTDHAVDEANSDNLTFDEILISVMKGDIIEDYPEDRPYPSCLVFGMTFLGKPVHSVWAYNRATKWTVLITVYRPDPSKWIDWRKRRNKDDSI